jgi:hypothetical protein
MRYILDHHRAKTERLLCRRDLKNMKLGGELKIVEGSKSSWLILATLEGLEVMARSICLHLNYLLCFTTSLFFQPFNFPWSAVVLAFPSRSGNFQRGFLPRPGPSPTLKIIHPITPSTVIKLMRIMTASSIIVVAHTPSLKPDPHTNAGSSPTRRP